MLVVAVVALVVLVAVEPAAVAVPAVVVLLLLAVQPFEQPIEVFVSADAFAELWPDKNT